MSHAGRQEANGDACRKHGGQQSHAGSLWGLLCQAFCASGCVVLRATCISSEEGHVRRARLRLPCGA